MVTMNCFLVIHHYPHFTLSPAICTRRRSSAPHVRLAPHQLQVRQGPHRHVRHVRERLRAIPQSQSRREWREQRARRAAQSRRAAPELQEEHGK